MLTRRRVIKTLPAAASLFRPSTPTAPNISVAIYQTDRLTCRNNRHPEQSLAAWTRHALNDSGFTTTIHTNFPPVANPYPATDAAKHRLLHDWSSRSQDPLANAYLLLYAVPGGGAAGLEQAVAGFGNVTRTVTPTNPEPREIVRNVWTGLHELGHALDGSHDTPMMTARDEMTYHANMKQLLHERYPREPRPNPEDPFIVV